MLVVAACGSSSTLPVGDGASSGGGGAGGGGGSAGEGGGVVEDVCPSVDGACRTWTSCYFEEGESCPVFDCGLPSTCSEVVFVQPNVDEPVYTLNTPEALVCLLEALRDDRPGRYAWAIRQPVGGHESVVHLLGGSTALVTLDRVGDLTSGHFVYNHGPVAVPANDWDACLAETDGARQVACLEMDPCP